MKIIQLSTLQETESDYSQLFAITDDGKILRCVMDGNFNWSEFAPISNAKELAATVPAGAAANTAIMQCRMHTEVGARCEVLGNDCLCGSEPCRLALHNS